MTEINSRLIYFQEPKVVKIHPESEVSCLMIVAVSSMLDIFTAIVCTSLE